MEINDITGNIIDACLKIHNNLGPGLFESVYEEVLYYELIKRGFNVERQVPIPVIYDQIKMEIGFRSDLIVQKLVIIEIKSTETIAPIHKKQVLTYLRLSNLRIVLLINFNEELLKKGITRLINNYSKYLYILCSPSAKKYFMTEFLQGYVKSSAHNGITSIEFFHPQSNSLPAKILDELAKEIHSAGNDHDTKVIILRSAGEKAFCAGASFDELIAIKNKEQGTDFFNGFAHVINAMRKCPQFVIARVQGKCVGGGVGLAAAADYTIAFEDADIKLSELAIGIGPFVVGPAIERKIGVSAFSQLAIDASLWRSADWAGKKGLYAELHHSIEAMDESLHRIANNLAHSNPEAIAAMKKIFWKGTEDWDHLLAERAAISGKLVLSEYAKNAIKKFKK